MNAYSVLLLYPDYASDGPETFFAHVFGASAVEALSRGRKEALEANPDIEDGEDFFALAVIAGHHEIELGAYDGV